jgi:AraC family transcriptional regulator
VELDRNLIGCELFTRHHVMGANAMTQPFNKVTPPPPNRRRFAWDNGVFETARRPFTDAVEGTLLSPHPILMVTLRGGAERHEFVTEDGFRHDGADRAGAMSFLPAGCVRRLRLRGIAWQWASITVRPELVAGGATSRSFNHANDVFVTGVLAEMERLHAADGALDPAYCDAMVLALTHYLDRHYWRAEVAEAKPLKLAPWRVRRVTDYVSANLAADIRIRALAELVGCSEGHFHRAFHATTGETPLSFIHRLRIERAMQALATEDVAITQLALRLGFVSPSHFARVFKSVTGRSPRAFRAAHQTH